MDPNQPHAQQSQSEPAGGPRPAPPDPAQAHAPGGGPAPGRNGSPQHPGEGSGGPAGAPGARPPAGISPPSAGDSFSPEVQAEIDAAMAELDRASGGGGGPRGAGGSGRAGPGASRRGGERAHAPHAPGPHPAAHAAIPGAKPAVLRGPRVVQAGREHRTGAVVSVGPTDIFIEFGPKELGVAPRVQWPEDQLPKVGEQVEVVVDRFEPAESLFVCSRPGAIQKAAWELLEVGQVVEARVVGVNKGGLELEVAGHRAFMPASQASLDRVEDLSVFMDQKWACKVSQLDRRGRGNIVLSRRDVLMQERQEQARALRERVKEGDIMQGTVRKIMPFGAFVDLGGIDGLVHMSDLTYDRVSYGEGAVGKYLKEGQSVTVKVLKVDWENNRLSLGIKQLTADPFSAAASQITEGAEVTGRVTRLTDFGAFVEVGPGVEGLVHVSEIAHRRIGKPADVLKVSEVVKAKVLRIDPETRKISLSIKALLPAPEVRGRDKRPAGRTAEEILKESPALRRLRERFGKTQFKGGLG